MRPPQNKFRLPCKGRTGPHNPPASRPTSSCPSPKSQSPPSSSAGPPPTLSHEVTKPRRGRRADEPTPTIFVFSWEMSGSCTISSPLGSPGGAFRQNHGHRYRQAPSTLSYSSWIRDTLTRIDGFLTFSIGGHSCEFEVHRLPAEGRWFSADGPKTTRTQGRSYFGGNTIHAHDVTPIQGFGDLSSGSPARAKTCRACIPCESWSL